MNKDIKTSVYCGIELPLEDVLRLMQEEEVNRQKVKAKLKKNSETNSIKIEDLIKEEVYEHRNNGNK